MWRAGGAHHRVRLQVPGPLPQRGPADPTVGLPAERHHQPGRDHPGTRSYRYVDYWGTAVTAFDLHAPHTELEVTSASVVETDKPNRPTVSVTWEDLDSYAVQDRYHEVLTPTRYTPFGKRTDRVARQIVQKRPAPRRSGHRQMGPQRTAVRPGHHRCALLRPRRPAGGWGVSGLRAPVIVDPVAHHGNSGPLRFRIPAPQTGCRRRRGPSRGESTPGSRLGRAAGGTRPDQQHRDQRAVHQRRIRPELCRRHAAEGGFTTAEGRAVWTWSSK